MNNIVDISSIDLLAICHLSNGVQYVLTQTGGVSVFISIVLVLSANRSLFYHFCNSILANRWKIDFFLLLSL